MLLKILVLTAMTSPSCSEPRARHRHTARVADFQGRGGQTRPGERWLMPDRAADILTEPKFFNGARLRRTSRAQLFHLMLQPMLGCWSDDGARPASSAST